MPNIGLIIPSFNRKQNLLDVLSDLSSQLEHGALLSIYVVIDGSTDGSIEAVSTNFPDVTIIEGDGDWYYTRSVNKGAEVALEDGADLLLMLNDDVRLKTNYLGELLKGHQQESTPCIMGSLSVTSDKTQRITFAGISNIKWWRMKWVNRIAPDTPADLSTLRGNHSSKVLPGRGMLVPAKVFMELNGFDERLPQYGSDDDFCLRAAEIGSSIKVNYNAVVFSHHKMTGAGNPVHRNSIPDILKAFRNKYSTLYLPKTAYMIKRHGNALLLPFTLSIVIIASLLSGLKHK